MAPDDLTETQQEALVRLVATADDIGRQFPPVSDMTHQIRGWLSPHPSDHWATFPSVDRNVRSLLEALVAYEEGREPMPPWLRVSPSVLRGYRESLENSVAGVRVAFEREGT